MHLPFLRSDPIALSDGELTHLEHHGCDAVRASAAITLGHFRKRFAVDNKASSGFDPVTQADRACEALIREYLLRELPGCGVFGEEAGYSPGDNGLTWVVDPIDGTRSYVCGVPLWGTLAGLSDGQRPILGIVYQPFTDELFVGSRFGARVERGQTAEPIRVSGVEALVEARLFCTSFDIFSASERTRFDKVASRVRLLRTGADCYAYAMLAAGHADLVVEAGLQCYDIYALIPIIEAAGGVVTDWAGGDASVGGTLVAAATPVLHAQALALLRGDTQ